MFKELPAESTDSPGVIGAMRLPGSMHAALRILGILAFLPVGAGCQRAVVSEPIVTTQSAVTAPPPSTFTITITTPNTVSPSTLALAAAHGIVLGASTTITNVGPALSGISNAGSGGIDAEPDAVLGNMWSISSVALKDRVHVLGTVHAPSAVLGNSVRIDGGLDSKTSLTPVVATSWTVTYPTGAAPNVTIQPNKSGSQVPGRYGSVQIFAGGTLTLSAGTYFVDTLDLEPMSKVMLNQVNGPVVIYVRGSIILRGTFTTTSASPPDLLIGYLGTAAMFVESPFNGAIVSASAGLTLRSVTGGHSGAFFAPTVTVDPHTSITFRPPFVLLTVLPRSLETCANAIVPTAALTGSAREIQYQQDILRYCTGVGISPCEQTVRARVNVDYFTAAADLYAGQLATSQYVAFLANRESQLLGLRANQTLACSVAALDSDDDLVPDAADACPNTPPLTPVLPNGCTKTALPPGPDINQIKKLFPAFGIPTDPRCVNAPTPNVPAALGAFRSPDQNASLGKSAWVSREAGTSPCPLFYQIEFYLTDGAGLRSATFPATEETAVPFVTPPKGAVQFSMHTTDGGDRGAWANYGVFTDSMRARAFNLSGKKSVWSGFFALSNVDCVAGQPCFDR